jgi:hypothetical protein
MKNVLLFVLFIVVCGYADRPRFDNEEDNKPEFDNNDYSYKDTKTPKGTFGETRFGIKIGSGLGASRFGKEKTEVIGYQLELGGMAIIPLTPESNIGSSFPGVLDPNATTSVLLDIELNGIARAMSSKDTSLGDTGLSIPLLLQFFMNNNKINIGGIFEAGIVLDIPIATYEASSLTGEEYYEYRKSFDPGFAFGAGLVIKKIIMNCRGIFYPIFDEFDTSLFFVGSLSIGYLF